MCRTPILDVADLKRRLTVAWQELDVIDEAIDQRRAGTAVCELMLTLGTFTLII